MLSALPMLPCLVMLSALVMGMGKIKGLLICQGQEGYRRAGRYPPKLTQGRHTIYALFSGLVFQNFVASAMGANLHRRHLTESQRAGIAVKLANMKVGGDGSNQHGSKAANLPVSSVSQKQAATLLDVGVSLVKDAKPFSINPVPALFAGQLNPPPLSWP